MAGREMKEGRGAASWSAPYDVTHVRSHRWCHPGGDSRPQRCQNRLRYLLASDVSARPATLALPRSSILSQLMTNNNKRKSHEGKGV